MTTVKILADDTAIKVALLEFDSYLLRDSSEHVLDLDDIRKYTSELISIELDSSATARRGELRILLKPSDRLLKLIAAAAKSHQSFDGE